MTKQLTEKKNPSANTYKTVSASNLGKISQNFSLLARTFSEDSDEFSEGHGYQN